MKLLFIVLINILYIQLIVGYVKINKYSYRNSKLNGFNELINIIHTLPDITHTSLSNIHITNPTSILLTDEVVETAKASVSIYSKVDKTGFIGFLADYVERAIDFGSYTFSLVGVKNGYGYSILLFTILVKILTLPLSTTQIESTTKLQKLTPLQQKIQAKYANDEQTKNQLLSQLFQVANVNPLAGCFPALVQIPIFISLYRALQNLVAENKLNQPFLWIPDLEGPVYTNPPETSLDWVKSIITGEPLLGWSDTLAFLSIPIVLYITQNISQKVLQPPKDPNKVLTDQEQFSQALLNYLPVIFSFFSLNVPAGLGIYWIANNILTTIITIFIRNQFKDEQLPVEVEQMMATIDGNTAVIPKKSVKPNSFQELRGNINADEKKSFGFAKTNVIDTVIEDVPVSSTISPSTSSSIIPTISNEVTNESTADDDKDEETDGEEASTDVNSTADSTSKRKKRVSNVKANKKKRN